MICLGLLMVFYGISGALIFQNGKFRSPDIFPHFLDHFWNFQQFQQIWSLTPLIYHKNISKNTRNSINKGSLGSNIQKSWNVETLLCKIIKSEFYRTNLEQNNSPELLNLLFNNMFYKNGSFVVHRLLARPLMATMLLPWEDKNLQNCRKHVNKTFLWGQNSLGIP